MIPSNLPPGVSESDPMIAGGPDEDVPTPVELPSREHKPRQSVFTGYTWCTTCGDLLIDPSDYLVPCA